MQIEGLPQDKTIGVLGGLGPEATLDFFAKLLAHTKASTDQEHIRVLIDNNPKVPNRNLAIMGRGPSPGPILAHMASDLERSGADFIVMACHTAHHYEKEIRAALTIPFVSMVTETCDELARECPGARSVGVLAVDGCRHSRLYDNALAQSGYRVLALDEGDQKEFMSLVYAIKQGDKSERVTRSMRELGEHLANEGAELVIAACTEVPLVVGENDLPCTLIDSTDVLARRCVDYARGEAELPRRRNLRSAS
ncbi:MAG: amino acid racemase [Gammaproteobacteria bacterium]|nr:amino acid racemase [Gammaproteobacteria bacterium]